MAVLGKVGSNFGAGMTGGLAWVLDEDGSFVREGRFHPDFVFPEAFSAVGIDAQVALQTIIEQHAAESSSSLALEMLHEWPRSAEAFVRLTPKPQV